MPTRIEELKKKKKKAEQCKMLIRMWQTGNVLMVVGKTL